MALRCPEGFDVDRLHERVMATYEKVAREPRGQFHFNRGMRYATQHLNYSPADLADVPRVSAARFVGAGNPHRIGPLNNGETVLDHACGAGLDLIIAARKVGAQGRALGVDMTSAMLECAWDGACMAGVDAWTSLFHARYEALPVDDASVDVVISNGVLNLAPDKTLVFKEIFRVLKPGGRLYLADAVIQQELHDVARGNVDLWAECIGGALLEPELLDLAALAGLEGAQITERFDCFSGCSAGYKVPPEIGLGAVNFFARKPLGS